MRYLLVVEERADGRPAVAVVTRPDAVRILVDSAQLRFLAPFLGAERSVAEVARQLGTTIDRVLGRVRRFVASGLLEVARVQPRPGRPVRLYRSPAAEFFVPLAAIALHRDGFRSEDLWHDRFKRGFELSMGAALGATPGSGVRVHRRTQDGRARIEAAAGPGVAFDELADGRPAVLYEWTSVRLDRSDAKELQRELHEVVGRFVGRQREGGREYVVGLCLTPSAGS